jgi:tetratricopeptide (TPR) repeat protein
LADFGSALELISPSDLGALQEVERGLGWCQLRREARTLAAVHFGRALRALDGRRGSEYDDAAAGLEQASKAGHVPAVRVAGTRKVSTSPKPEASPVPLQGRLRADLGEAFYRVGLYQHALAAYKEALAIDERSSRAACGMGWAALKIGRLSEASAAFRRVKVEVGLEPSLIRDTQHGLAWIAYREGNVEDAIKHFRRALKGTDPKREAALVRDIERGLRRAQYLAGAGKVTLKDLARGERRSRVDLAIRLQGRAMANRLSRLVGRARVNRWT